MAGFPWDHRRARRLAVATFTAAVLTLAVLFVSPWVPIFITPKALRQAAIGFLIGLEILYGLVLLTVLFSTPVFGSVLYLSRTNGLSRPMVARGLIVCISCLFGLALSEAIAAARLAAIHRAPPLTKGDPELTDGFIEPTAGDVVTLAVLGESSAAGVPYESWLSVGEIVAWQLGKAIPGQRFRVEMLAKPGDTMEGQYQKLAGLRRRPDALIVYCGHNEFAAGIPWWRWVDHYGQESRSLFAALHELAGTVSSLSRLIRETADKYRVAQDPAFNARPPLVNVPAYTPGEFNSRLERFRRRLEAITAYGERIGALPILVVPPSNDAGFEPNRSFLPAVTPASERAAFARDFPAARESEDRDPATAIKLYRALSDRQPGFAETHYRLARLLEHTGAWDEAYQQYVAARDLDGLPMRCVTIFQQAYRDVAARHECILVDGQALFHAIGPHGLLDDHLFQDAMHPSLRGQIVLAQAILEALHSRRAFNWSGAAPPALIDPACCAAHFGLEPKDWKSLCEKGAMFYFATAGLRHDRSQRLAKQRSFEKAARRIGAGEPPEAVGLPNVGVPAIEQARPGPTAFSITQPARPITQKSGRHAR